MARGASTASDKAGERSQRRVEGGEGGKRWRQEGSEGVGLRAAHLARTQLVAKRSEFCDCGSVGKEKGVGEG